MDIAIMPSQTVDVAVAVAGSKSYTNRVLAVGALAEGESLLKNALISDDTLYMMNALEKMGVWIQQEATSSIRVIGGNGHFPPYAGEIYIKNAGTAMRFLTTMLTLGSGEYLISGNERMQERPIKDLVVALKAMGVSITARKDEFPPLKIKAEGLPGGKVSMRGETSSQYLSSLLISAPYAKRPLELTIEGNLVSKPYIDMTIDIMRLFGAYVEHDNYRVFRVRNNYGYTGREFDIEADASNASYFFAIPAVIGGRLCVTNISCNTKQGDIHFVDILEKMGCEVRREDSYIEVCRKAEQKLIGIDVDMSDMPDVAQTLAVVALSASSPTRITGIGNLRVKETDRIEALATEIRRLGGKVETGESEITIYPCQKYNGAKIETYDDHRMAMSFSLAGLFIEGVSIDEPDCVSKSFPDYFKVFNSCFR